MNFAIKVIDLAGQIYDCVERPELWATTVEAIADSLGASVTGFSVVDMSRNAGSVGINRGADEVALRQYDEHYFKLNVHNSYARRMPIPPAQGTVVNSFEWGIKDEVLRSEYYNDFLRPLHAFHFISGIVTQDESCLAAFTCYRPVNGELFTDDSIMLLKMLLPHLQRAVHLNQRLNLLRSTTEDFEDLATGAILFDRSGRVLRINQRGRKIIDQNDGLTLRRGAVELASARQNNALKKLISDCCATSLGRGSGAGDVLAIQRTSGKMAYQLLISPIRFSLLVTGSRGPAAILFISDPEDAPQIPEKTLAKLYGLTTAEARLSNLLLKGSDLTDACALSGTSRNT